MKIKLEDFWVKNGRNSRPIPDKEVINFLNKSISPKYLYDENILTKFLNTYYDWLKSSKLNKLNGLEKFSSLGFVHGTSQSFDLFTKELLPAAS